MKIVQIVGAGAWGSALSIALSKKHKVTLVTQNKHKITKLQNERVNDAIPGAIIPGEIIIQDHLAPSADYTIISVTTNAIAQIIQKNLQYFRSQPNIIISSKGMDPESGKLLSEILEYEKIDPLFLAGPNFAIEIAKKQKASANIAAKNYARAITAASELSCETLELLPLRDYITMQICGCYKNILSIYCGYIIEKGLGNNFRAKICTDAILELMEICKHIGCDPGDVLSYSGIGDIMLSCFSDQSRNFQFGQIIARGEVMPRKISIEGISAARLLYEKCESLNQKPQILSGIYNLILNYSKGQ
ncbi:MAG: NAD(P)H-dependent glycerol-3-phosphate dehydrogenase [Rickettsiaceae bacterium]|nr:NAD(P)H-dependent glycerol-3-phosphate dehydrogenase [Rickettsiaceae bacterium]